MQRYGPPPSYPNLKIPGLNAPIPEGCSFGYHAGGWGKPPVDENGKPLYGDVFGVQNSNDEVSKFKIQSNLFSLENFAPRGLFSNPSLNNTENVNRYIFFYFDFL